MGGELKIPVLLADFQKLSFNLWLANKGWVALTTTNEWEVSRYRYRNPGSLSWQVGIVYRTKSNKLTYSGDTGLHYMQFLKDRAAKAAEQVGQVFNAMPKEMASQIVEALSPASEAKKKLGQKRKKVQKIAKRDGWGCFYCPATLDVYSATIEHLVPTSKGGENGMVNLALACKSCNSEAGHLSVMEKVKLREKKRFAKVKEPKDGGTHGS